MIDMINLCIHAAYLRLRCIHDLQRKLSSLIHLHHLPVATRHICKHGKNLSVNQQKKRGLVPFQSTFAILQTEILK